MLHPHHTERPANGDVSADQLLTGPRPHRGATQRGVSVDGGEAPESAAVCYGAIGNRISVKGAPGCQGKDNPVMTMKEGQKGALPVVRTDPKGSLSHQTSSELTSDLDSEEDGEPCSWGPLKPPWCQMFRSPKVVLFCLCWAGAIQVQ